MARIGVINLAYRIILRHIIPIAGVRYFASNVRYVTQVIICFLRLPVRSVGFYEQFGIVGQHTNKFYRVWGKRGAAVN